MTGDAQTPPAEPISIWKEMMRTTMTLAQSLNISPFEIFKQECDDVILLINYFVVLSKEKPQEKTNLKPKAYKYGSKNERIHVDDSTATGGWY